MKVKLEFAMIVDTEEMTNVKFDELCDRFKSFKDNMPMIYPAIRTWYAINEVAEDDGFYTLYESGDNSDPGTRNNICN